MAWVVAAEVMFLAIYAQMVLTRHVGWGLVVYAMALGLGVWVIREDSRLLGKVRPLPVPPCNVQIWYRHRWRLLLLGVSAVATAVNVACSWDDTFETAGVVAWVVSVGAFVATFWERGRYENISLARLGISRDGWRLSWFAVAFLVVLGLGAGFHLWRLRQIPPEMGWDHLRNLLDVRDVVERGLRPSFFCRNNGREPWQFYWTAALIWLTGLPVGFYALKLGTAIAGLLIIPGVYLMARELYGRWVGLWAALFVCVASWPVILNRLGLRCPLGPLSCAWAFYFMLRGLRTGHRNDFLLLGLALGVGLYGYMAFRVIPLAVVVCWGVVWLAARRRELGRRLSLGNLVLTVLSTLLVFVPLGGFMLYHPQAFWLRTSWYMTMNKPAGPPLLVFLDNLKNLALMFHWRGDEVVLNTLLYEPVLDPILGGLMVVGLVTALGRIFSRRQRDSLTLGLLVVGVIALLPSALSLSFPNENPSVMRASCGIPVVFTLAALPVGVWTEGVARAWGQRWQRVLAWAGVLVLIVAVVWANGHRIFVRYPDGYRKVLVNTSEIAAAIWGFDAAIGSVDDAYVVDWPYWVDVRALAFELGLPDWSNQLENADQAVEHTGEEKARMYILHPSDEASLRRLCRLFPDGLTHTYRSQWGRDFVLYVVPSGMQTEGAP